MKKMTVILLVLAPLKLSAISVDYCEENKEAMRTAYSLSTGSAARELNAEVKQSIDALKYVKEALEPNDKYEFLRNFGIFVAVADLMTSATRSKYIRFEYELAKSQGRELSQQLARAGARRMWMRTFRRLGLISAYVALYEVYQARTLDEKLGVLGDTALDILMISSTADSTLEAHYMSDSGIKEFLALPTEEQLALVCQSQNLREYMITLRTGIQIYEEIAAAEANGDSQSTPRPLLEKDYNLTNHTIVPSLGGQ